MDELIGLPLLWAQAATVPPAAGTSTGMATGGGPAAGPSSLLLLALRRWCGSLTLSPPTLSADLLPGGFWAWALGLGVLLAVALLVQGPARAIGQVLDLSGHGRLLAAGLDRFRRSGRMLALALGLSVVAWTASQTFSYSVATGRDDLVLLTKGRRALDVALDQGTLAALTPLRDVVGLGLMIPLLIGAAVVLFQFSTDRWGSTIRPPLSIRRRAARWSTLGWGCTALYALYRFVGLVTGTGELPLGGCLVPEVVIVPALMAMADGVLVAWVLVELRNAGLGDREDDGLDVCGATLLIPAAALGCVLAFPARYISAAVTLALPYIPPGIAATPSVASFLRWELGWGLVDLQGAGLAFAGLLGAAAWSRGTVGDALRGYGRLIAAEGGHLVAALALGGLAAGALAASSYLLVLSLPSSPWVLAAADSYAHYATLPVGLILLAVLIELGERSLPMARPAAVPAEAEAEAGAVPSLA